MHDRHRAGWITVARPFLLARTVRGLSASEGGKPQCKISYKTIATFCEHTTEMLEGVSDNAELVRRHRASLERLRDGLARLLEG